jgi:hypothetical protein
MRWTLLVALVFVLATPMAARTQLMRGGETAELVPLKPRQQIPGAPFNSWSLLLVCDPAWLLPSLKSELVDLQVRYIAFGKTTGPAHAAVWFEPFIPSLIREDGKVLSWSIVPGSVDIEQNIEYCRRFNLIPSDGPHIVVTTIHPDRWQAGDPAVVLAFAGRAARDIQAQLSKLNDQIAAGRLSQEELNSVRWWTAWQQLIESACKWLKGVKWVVDVKVLKIEKSGVCS